jgi:hypothetical protein
LYDSIRLSYFELPMPPTRILHRNLGPQLLPTAVAGEGIHLIDADGRRYIDASGGAAVSCLGHGHPRVRAAMHRQLDAIAYAHTSFFTTAVAEELAERLIAEAPAGLAHVYLVSGGSEAVEAALKLARQYFVEIGQPERRNFIARRQSYHGNTLGALAVGGNALRRAQFAPLLIETTHVAPCYEYRDRAPQETPEAYSQRLVRELEMAIERLGGGNVIAFVAETVVGATAGAVPPTPGYFRRIRELCDRHGILLILDEVMCGMGRTGTLHACEQEGVVPDLMTIAKGLGGGYGVDRRDSGCGTYRRRTETRLRRLPAWTHVHRSCARVRRGARRAGHDPRRGAARQGARARRRPRASVGSSVRRPPSRRRHSRPWLVSRARARCRSLDQGDPSLRDCAFTRASRQRACAAG